MGDLRCEFTSGENDKCTDLFTSEDSANTTLDVLIRNEARVLDSLSSRLLNCLEARFDSWCEEGKRIACACAGFCK